jgi:hypothetical protein
VGCGINLYYHEKVTFGAQRNRVGFPEMGRLMYSKLQEHNIQSNYHIHSYVDVAWPEEDGVVG